MDVEVALDYSPKYPTVINIKVGWTTIAAVDALLLHRYLNTTGSLFHHFTGAKMIRAVANRINKSGTKSQSCQHTIPSNPVGENYDETGRDEKTQAEVEPTDHSRSSNPDIKSGKCQECAREKRAARGHRWKLIIGLMPAYFLASLDVTIVATALPFIASHFSEQWP